MLSKSTEYFEPSPIPTHHARPFGCEVLETVKIRSPRLVQGNHLAIDNSVVGKITKRLRDLRESFVEVLVVSRIQDCFPAGFDSDDAVAVEFDLAYPFWSLGNLTWNVLRCVTLRCSRLPQTAIFSGVLNRDAKGRENLER